MTPRLAVAPVAVALLAPLWAAPSWAQPLTGREAQDLSTPDLERRLATELARDVVDVIRPGGLARGATPGRLTLILRPVPADYPGLCLASWLTLSLDPGRAAARPGSSPPSSVTSAFVAPRYRALEAPPGKAGLQRATQAQCDQAGPAVDYFRISDPFKVDEAVRAIRTALARLRASDQAWACSNLERQTGPCPPGDRSAIVDLAHLGEVDTFACGSGEGFCLEAKFLESATIGGLNATLRIEGVTAGANGEASIGQHTLTSGYTILD